MYQEFIRLLPLQGALLTATIPRAMPWARSFWAFSPFLNHIRKFSYVILLQLIRDADAAVDWIHRLLDGLEILLEDAV